MKAAQIRSFGGPEVIQMEEVPRPRPGPNEVVVRVGASSINHIDSSVRAGELKLLTQFQLPKTLGFDLAGEIVECGSGVTAFLPGERVAGMTGFGAGSAEYCSVDQSQLTVLPPRIEWADAAALPLAGATALQALRELAKLRAGQRILINGAAGGVGSFAVQLARIFGAKTTAVCRAAHFDHVRNLGADETVDYQAQPLTELGERYDVIFDAAAKLDTDQIKRLVHHGGHVVTTRPEPKQVIESLVERVRGAFHLHFILTKPRGGDFALLLRLWDQERLKACVVRSFPLIEAAEAHRFFDNESIAGKVVIIP
jgi:NADPH:quinone reductase-like Zn-dependent oxidoreductase